MPCQWTDTRRQAQAERIRQTQPWKKATGPRDTSPTRLNASRGKGHDTATRQARWLIKQYRALRRSVLEKLTG